MSKKQTKSKLVKWLMKKEFFKSELSANFGLLSFSVATFLISMIIWTGGEIVGLNKAEAQVFDEDVYIILSDIDGPVLIPAGKEINSIIKKYENRQ